MANGSLIFQVFIEICKYQSARKLVSPPSQMCLLCRKMVSGRKLRPHTLQGEKRGDLRVNCKQMHFNLMLVLCMPIIPLQGYQRFHFNAFEMLEILDFSIFKNIGEYFSI